MKMHCSGVVVMTICVMCYFTSAFGTRYGYGRRGKSLEQMEGWDGEEEVGGRLDDGELPEGVFWDGNCLRLNELYVEKMGFSEATSIPMSSSYREPMSHASRSILTDGRVSEQSDAKHTTIRIGIGKVNLNRDSKKQKNKHSMENESDMMFHESVCLDETALREPKMASPISMKSWIESVQQESRSGIPADTICNPTKWCDDNGVCTTVCARGSVQVEPWLAAATRLQAQLARTLPFCFTTMLGTHNSAITLADGYGNLDPVYQSLFKYIKWSDPQLFKDAMLRTNNQYLSLTDQLNLGVRSLELDTHWVQGALRIAHCGGLHVGSLNALVRTLNALAKLFGMTIHWDTETLGCNPSLSSIAAKDQRTLNDALQEIKLWMDKEDNVNELLVLFFDDQPDLQRWGVSKYIKEDILDVFPREWIFTTEDLAASGGIWPTASEMVRGGRRLVLVSIQDYGRSVAPLFFTRDKHVCSWKEPPLANVEGEPACQVHSWGLFKSLKLFSGTFVRVGTCQLQYGPLNCDFQWNQENNIVLDNITIPGVVQCNLNMPCPDLLTPRKAAASIWTWAVGHPFLPENGVEKHGNTGFLMAHGQGPANCAIVNASDGRWRAVQCMDGTSDDDFRVVTPCRPSGSKGWRGSPWVLGIGRKGLCPEGSFWDAPRHPQENQALTRMLERQGMHAAWLPLSGPSWKLPIDLELN